MKTLFMSKSGLTVHPSQGDDTRTSHATESPAFFRWNQANYYHGSS